MDLKKILYKNDFYIDPEHCWPTHELVYLYRPLLQIELQSRLQLPQKPDFALVTNTIVDPTQEIIINNLDTKVAFWAIDPSWELTLIPNQDWVVFRETKKAFFSTPDTLFIKKIF